MRAPSEDERFYKKILPYSADSAAYELKRRGWELKAVTEPPVEGTNYVQELNQHPQLIWRQRYTHTAPDVWPAHDLEPLKAACYFGARYHLVFTYRNDFPPDSKIHYMLTCERYQGANPKYRDQIVLLNPSNQVYGTIEEFKAYLNAHKLIMSDAYFYRVDDCAPLPYYAQRVLTAVNPTAQTETKPAEQAPTQGETDPASDAVAITLIEQ